MLSAANLISQSRPSAFKLTAASKGIARVIESVLPVVGINSTHIVQRLNELGFLPGETVTLLHRGPGGCEPIAVQVADTVFALRKIEADCILVHDLDIEGS